MVKMKTKSFLLFSTTVFAISIFLIVFHSQPPQSFQSIVSQTHQHIKNFQQASLTQEQLRDVEERHLVQEERYLSLVGLAGHVELWKNTTVPVLVTHARNDDHALVVAFIRAAQKLPYTILVYNLGLKPYSLNVISNYCNSSKCVVIDFDLTAFPAHVNDESITAFRPLIIQHALSRVGGVVYCSAASRWRGSAAELEATWRGAAASLGVVAWPRRAAVTSLTHPHMFTYFHADVDDFLFVQMLDTSRLVLAACDRLAPLMRPWVQCALTADCIMPVGRRSVGGLPVRQEAAISVFGVPRTGRVGAEHHPGAPQRVRRERLHGHGGPMGPRVRADRPEGLLRPEAPFRPPQRLLHAPPRRTLRPHGPLRQPLGQSVPLPALFRMPEFLSYETLWT